LLKEVKEGFQVEVKVGSTEIYPLSRVEVNASITLLR